MGHVPMHLIEENMAWVARAARLRSVATRRRHSRPCHEAPFYTLGPLTGACAQLPMANCNCPIVRAAGCTPFTAAKDGGRYNC